MVNEQTQASTTQRHNESLTDFEVQSIQEDELFDPQPNSVGINFRYIVAGIILGIIFVKSEVISWFRIQEMFRLQSFHMYGIIGSAIIVAMISVLLIKKFDIKTIDGKKIRFYSRKFSMGQIFGGLMFGLGWALTGACPGPIYAQIGSGFTVVIITLLSAIAGTWTYGLLKPKLPH